MKASSPDSPPVVVVAGPTAAGKTPLAVDLAEQFEGEIVNADSMQVYRYLEIGTAKPSRELRSRVPHHLYDIANPDQSYDAGRYGRDARRAAAAIHRRAKSVFLCGGTGLYIQSFLRGLLNTTAADPALRGRLEAEARRAAEGGMRSTCTDGWLPRIPRARPRSTPTTGPGRSGPWRF